MNEQQLLELNRRIDSLQASHIDDNSQLRKSIDNLMVLVKPMAETYGAASRIGKWTAGLLSFVLLVTSVLIALKDLFKTK